MLINTTINIKIQLQVAQYINNIKLNNNAILFINIKILNIVASYDLLIKMKIVRGNLFPLTSNKEGGWWAG